MNPVQMTDRRAILHDTFILASTPLTDDVLAIALAPTCQLHLKACLKYGNSCHGSLHRRTNSSAVSSHLRCISHYKPYVVLRENAGAERGGPIDWNLTDCTRRLLRHFVVSCPS